MYKCMLILELVGNCCNVMFWFVVYRRCLEGIVRLMVEVWVLIDKECSILLCLFNFFIEVLFFFV